MWEDFVDIFYAPSSVFARRADGKFGLPLLFLIVVGTVLFFLTKNAMQPIMDAEFARQTAAAMRRNPNITAEQIASGRGFFETLAPFFFAIGLTLGVFGTGVVLWLVSKLFDAKESVAAAIMIATYSEVPRIVQIVVNAAQALFMSPEKLNAINSVGFNPARFMDPDHASAVAIALAARFDLFTIWITVLLGIGIYVVGKVTKQQAAIIAVVTWVAGALPAVLGALRQG
ncbi:MAG TPA: YIP1 family protein [Gemmatimonadaceae bacterium]